LIAAIPALARVLDLDASVFEYVPALRQLQPVAHAERITPRHLLTQRWVL
jgi:CubicO group peptidase (beta-lactamase class C family)